MRLSSLSLVFLAFTLVGGVYLGMSLALPGGTIEQPGAGFFPRMVGVFVLALSIPGLVFALKPGGEASPTEDVFPRGQDLRRVMAIVAVIFLFAVLLHPLGYGICSAVLMAAVLRLLGMQGRLKILIVAALAAAVSFYFFTILDIPLPRGSLLP